MTIYRTGLVSTLAETYDALASFMTASGWSLYDNIPITGSRDKVFYSSGSDGTLSMYIRLSSNAAGNPWKSADDIHVAAPHIFIRGYHNWNASQHSGAGEYGIFGPTIFGAGEVSATGRYWFLPAENGAGLSGSLTTLQSNTEYQLSGAVPGLVMNTAFNLGIFDGRRKWWATSSTQVAYHDLSGLETVTVTPGLGTLSYYYNSAIITRDNNTDKEYIWALSSTDTQWIKVDADTLAVSRMTAYPSGAAAGVNMCWDGGDWIYSIRANVATSQFNKYRISTNTWVSLAATPVAVSYHTPGSSQPVDRMVYIPSGTSGLSEDVIYAYIADSGTTIYRYDVTSNTWRTTGATGALTSPFTLTTAQALVWDKQRYIYLISPALNHFYRADALNTFGTCSFQDMGDPGTTSKAFEGLQVLNFNTGKVRCNDVMFSRYYFCGDADSINIVNRLGSDGFTNGRYYWSYFGKYNTVYRTNVMTATSAITGSVRCTVNVDSTSGYYQGETILAANYSQSYFERPTIYQIINSSSFSCTLTGTFASGTKFGIDPGQTIIGGDCGWGVAKNDAAGYKTDFESAIYQIQPEYSASQVLRMTPTVRGTYIPNRMMVFNQYKPTGNKYETLGYLRGVYSLMNRSAPAPQSEDILVFGGHQYIYFNLQEVSRNAQEKRGIVIGPIT